MTISTEYRSKDAAFMKSLKDSIYETMENEPKTEAQDAWSYMRKRVKMDDLHRYAIDKLDTDEAVQMGVGDLHSELLVLSMRPIHLSKEGRELTEAIIKSGKFERVYYTAKYKVQTVYKEDIPIFEEILNTEIKFLKPKAILCFGDVLGLGLRHLTDYEGIPVIQTHLISPILASTDEEEVKRKKAEIWNDVKQIKKYYKM